jgi:hypothetical protein
MPEIEPMSDKVRDALKVSLCVMQSLVDPKPAESALHVYAKAKEAEVKIRTLLGVD